MDYYEIRYNRMYVLVIRPCGGSERSSSTEDGSFPDKLSDQ
jgi:hypothetical protein